MELTAMLFWFPLGNARDVRSWADFVDSMTTSFLPDVVRRSLSPLLPAGAAWQTPRGGDWESVAEWHDARAPWQAIELRANLQRGTVAVSGCSLEHPAMDAFLRRVDATGNWLIVQPEQGGTIVHFAPPAPEAERRS